MQSTGNIWPNLQHFHCVYHPQPSRLMGYTNGIIKTQLANFSETFKLPWPKAEPIVLFSLNSTPLENSHSTFKIVTGCPMHLNEGAYESTY